MTVLTFSTQTGFGDHIEVTLVEILLYQEQATGQKTQSDLSRDLFNRNPTNSQKAAKTRLLLSPCWFLCSFIPCTHKPPLPSLLDWHARCQLGKQKALKGHVNTEC